MTIYHVTEYDKPFVYMTHPPALQNVGRELGAEVVIYPFHQFAYRQIERDSSPDAIWVVEGAYPEMSGMSFTELRTFVPNGKIMCIGGDTVVWTRKGEDHVKNPEVVDLWVDLLDEVVDYYRDKGITTDSWMWTVSESMINGFAEYTDSLPVDFDNKFYDFISYMSIGNQYRQDFVKYFRDQNAKFVTGVVCTTPNVEEMIDVYRQSWFHVGNTSPSWTVGIRTMKGFRDWLAPALNTVLIYDSHPDIIRKYEGGTTVPLYDYNDFSSISKLMEKLRSDKELYSSILQKQKDWLSNNTLERQFLRTFKKHNFI